MARSTRQIVPDICYHVLNRGNDRQRIFHKQADYGAFVGILSEGLSRFEVELFCWCLMPNHWHLVVRPVKEKSLSEFMRWITVTHVRRYYQQYPQKSGHLYQGRFKAFAVEEDQYFLNLCRYVEANAKRGKLVDDAQQWRWSSLAQRLADVKVPQLTPWPLDRPRGWIDLVNEPPSEEELQEIKTSLVRGRPFGSDHWARRIALGTGALQSLLPLGRPLKPLAKLSARQLRRRRAKDSS